MSVDRILDFLVGVPAVGLLSLFAGRKKEIPPAPKRILVVKLAAVGDTILVGSVIKPFRAAHPDAVIHWLVSPINAAMAKTYPWTDKILVWNGGVGGLFALTRALRAENYDVVVDLEQWSRGTALLSYFSGAPIRLGFDTPGQHRAGLFNASVRKQYDKHEIEEFSAVLSLIKPFGAPRELELAVTDAGRAELAERPLFDRRRPVPKRLIVVHPGCGADGLPREWPLSNYAVLGHWLLKDNDTMIVLTSGPEESFKTKKLNALLNNRAVDLGGCLSWQALIALVEKADLVISGNTGVMHVAAALRKKQVAVHGPTNPLLWGPLNPNAKIVQSDCPKCPCLKLGFEYHAKDGSCMRRIDVETVKAAVSSSFDNHGAI